MQLQIDDCNLFVQVQYKSSAIPKNVKWVLLMHGFPDTSDMWESQISALSAAGYAVAAPDMPGFGRSSFTQPQNVKHYSLRNIVLIMRGLLDHLGVQQAAVVGHDWGAAVAWSFALQCPDRLSHLVVLSVGHPGGGAAVDARQRAHWWYQLFFCLPGAEAAVVANDWALFRQIMGSSCSSTQLQAYIQQLQQPGALSSALNWYRANTHPRHFAATAPAPVTRPVTVPVLGVWPSGDSALLEPQMLASEAFVAPGCWQYVRLEGVGHWIARDAAGQLNRLLLQFLSGGLVEGGSGSGGGGQGQQQQSPHSRL